MAQRKRYSADFKAKVALEAIKGQRTANEIASDYGIHPAQIAQWKKQLLDQLPEIFSDKRAKQDTDQEQLEARLYQQIGQLQFELEWLKKKVGQLR